MSDERRDDETGRALGRAVGSQTVRETPFAESRIARRLERPASRGWTYALPVAAALALFVAMGAFFATRGPEGGVAAPDPSATPGTSAPPATSSASGPSPAPTATPTLTLVRTYFARDGLPPVGVDRAFEMEPGFPANVPADQRVGRLLAALGSKTAPTPAGLIDAFPRSDPAGYHGQRVTVAGDLASIDFEIRALNGDWGVRGAAQTQALLQQIVYTATEVPGIRRVLLTQNGRPLAIDQLVIDKPLSREDVLGYDVKSPEISVDGELAADVVDWRASVDDVTPGLGRFVVELKPAGQNPQFSVPAFTAKLEAARNANDQEPGKYVLRLELAGAYWPQATGEAFKCCQVKTVDKTPIRRVSAYPLGTGNGRPGVGFGIELDDARPWRVFVMDSPLRVVVDIGGHPDAVSEDIAVYAPRPGAEVARTFTVSGAARTFESTVTWRLRDSSNRVVANGFTTSVGGSGPQWGAFQFSATAPAAASGNVTLEVLWGSPRDGSDMGLVAIPLRIR